MTETVPTGSTPTTPIMVTDIVVTSGIEFVAFAGQANLPIGSTKQEVILNRDMATTPEPDLKFGNTDDNGAPPQRNFFGKKFNDANRNGIQDPNEADLSGVEIRLYIDANDNGLLDQTEFDGDAPTPGFSATAPFLPYLVDISNAIDGFAFQNVTVPDDSFIIVEVINGSRQTDVIGPAMDSTGPNSPSKAPILAIGLITGTVELGNRGYALSNLQPDTNITNLVYGNSTTTPTKFSFLVTSLQPAATTSTAAVSQQAVAVSAPAASSVAAPPLPFVANTAPSQALSTSTTNSTASETATISTFRSQTQTDALVVVAANQTEIGSMTLESAVLQSTPAVFVTNLEATLIETEPAGVSSTPNSVTSQPVVSAKPQSAQTSSASPTVASARQKLMASMVSAIAIPTSNNDPLPSASPATAIVNSTTNAAVPAAAVGKSTPATVGAATTRFASGSTTSMIPPPATSPASAIDTSATNVAVPATFVGNGTPATVGAVTARFVSNSTTSVIPPPHVAESLPEPVTGVVSTAITIEPEPVVVDDRLGSESPVIEGSINDQTPTSNFSETTATASSVPTDSLLIVNQQSPGLANASDPIDVAAPALPIAINPIEESVTETHVVLSLRRLIASALLSRVLSAIDSDADETDEETPSIQPIDTSTTLSDLVMADMETPQTGQLETASAIESSDDTASEESAAVDEFFRLLAE